MERNVESEETVLLSHELFRPTLTLISRQSKLALIQTEAIKDMLENFVKSNLGMAPITFPITTTVTQGDKILDVALAKIGDKGLFTKELEVSLLNKTADIAVHSLKDMPTRLPEGLIIGAITRRHDPSDVVVMNSTFSEFTLETLPPESLIGTSSLRRIAQLSRAFPHLRFLSIRGNLATRLRKLDEPQPGEPQFCGIILAKAGLERQGLGHRIHQTIPTEICFPAVGQGALGIECRSDDLYALEILKGIHCSETAACCTAERAFLRSLEGGCQVPVAVSSVIDANLIVLKGRVLSLDGSVLIEGSSSSPTSLPEDAGNALAIDLLSRGATEILSSVYSQ